MNTDATCAEDEEVGVEPEWVRSCLAKSDFLPLDCSSHRAVYEQGHLPGALFVDWISELTWEEGAPDEDDALYFFYLCLKRGIRPNTLCVFYSEVENDRAWQALRIFRHFGHHRVKLLKGGREAWIRRGYPLNLPKEISKTASYLSPAEIVSVAYCSHEM